MSGLSGCSAFPDSLGGWDKSVGRELWLFCFLQVGNGEVSRRHSRNMLVTVAERQAVAESVVSLKTGKIGGYMNSCLSELVSVTLHFSRPCG